MRDLSSMAVGLMATGLLFCSTSITTAATATALFNGKDLSGWKVAAGKDISAWKIGTAALDPADPKKLIVKAGGTDLVTPEKGVNLYTVEEFVDCVLELEFMLAKDSNAGIKMMNLYEIQLLDSYGKEPPSATDCGAIYKESPPKVNACKKAGEWQKLVIDFRAPRFDQAGNKVASAKFVKVLLNGKVIQENYEIAYGTNVPKTTKQYPRATLFLQGDHGPVAFRNIQITRLD